MDYIKAAGGIVSRKGAHGAEIVLVHRPRHNDWSIPKGKLERDESWQDAAIREVEEETSCRVRLGEFAGAVLYKPGRTLKLSLFWNMECIEELAFAPTSEIDAILWLPVADAITKLDHVDEKELLREVFPS